MEDILNEGEKTVQRLAGVEKEGARVARLAIKNRITPGLFPYIQGLPMAFVGSTDAKGQLWSSLLIGEVGFIEVPHMHEVCFHRSKIQSTASDIFFKNITERPEIGIMFKDPSQRIRYRVNGIVTEVSEDSIRIKVVEAYGNCPKYIQARKLLEIKNLPESTQTIFKDDVLGAKEKDWIRKADTFYIATRSLDGRADASHRGGNPGFVEILSDGTFKIPDYYGNNMFNSLGNIYENPNTGLLFVDFETGATLQLSGKGKILFDQTTSNDMKKTGDTGRFWLFTPEQWIHTKQHHQAKWDFIQYSPFNP
ncbi:pyridoxamine 5'-phosphate oxidase family protein [Dokdonia sp.]|uniref:pyridoxamine 5'-phosphate oxidase family protein n=1 Tax=Dokdonia sp. TaxID=2024995 RepID=UPI0032632CD1